MGTAIKLSEQELEALSECSSDAFKIYVLGIRPSMDFTTGYVGRVWSFSYRSIMHAMEQFKPPAGSHVPTKVWTKSAIKNRLEELAKFGLISWLRTATRGLLLKCTRADYDKKKGFEPGGIFRPAGATTPERCVPNDVKLKEKQNDSGSPDALPTPRNDAPPVSVVLSGNAAQMDAAWVPDRAEVESVSRETIGLDISGLDENRYHSVVREFAGFWAARSTRRDEVGWLHHLARSFEHNMREPTGRGRATRNKEADLIAAGERQGLAPWPGESTQEFGLRVRSRMAVS